MNAARYRNPPGRSPQKRQATLYEEQGNVELIAAPHLTAALIRNRSGLTGVSVNAELTRTLQLPRTHSKA